MKENHIQPFQGWIHGYCFSVPLIASGVIHIKAFQAFWFMKPVTT